MLLPMKNYQPLHANAKAVFLSFLTTAHASKSLFFTIRSVSRDNLYIALNATYMCQRLGTS